MFRLLRRPGLWVQFRARSVCVAIACVVAGTSLAIVNLAAQTPVGIYNGTPQIFVTVGSPTLCSDSTTTLPAGGYLAPSIELDVNAEATGGGVCQWWDNGVDIFDQQRYVENILGSFTLPDLSVSTFPWYAGAWENDYDTRNGTGTEYTGDPYELEIPTEIGQYIITAQEFGGGVYASCNVPPSSAITSQTFNVMACQPLFDVDGNGNIDYVVPLTPPSTIQVYLPTSMSDANSALDAAIADWNSYLPTGVQFERVSSSCGTGPSCISIATLALQTDCGISSATGVDPATGAITAGMTITFRPDWDTLPYTPTGLQRTFDHELGHFLGMADYPSTSACGISTAVMQPMFDCTVSDMDTVTPNDYVPVVATVYGGGTRVSCGF